MRSLRALSRSYRTAPLPVLIGTAKRSLAWQSVSCEGNVYTLIAGVRVHASISL